MDRRDLSRALLVAVGASVLGARPAEAASPENLQSVATRGDLKALNTGTTTTAYLAEGGREGLFVWKTGNFTSQLAADGFEGIYIKANAVSITAGCWVRALEEPGVYHMDWFGASGAADILPIWNKAAAIAAGGNAQVWYGHLRDLGHARL